MGRGTGSEQILYGKGGARIYGRSSNTHLSKALRLLSASARATNETHFVRNYRGYASTNSWMIRSDLIPAQFDELDERHPNDAELEVIDWIQDQAPPCSEMLECQLLPTERRSADAPDPAKAGPYLAIKDEDEYGLLMVPQHSVDLIRHLCGSDGAWHRDPAQFELFYFVSEQEKPIASVYIEMAEEEK